MLAELYLSQLFRTTGSPDPKTCEFRRASAYVHPVLNISKQRVLGRPNQSRRGLRVLAGWLAFKTVDVSAVIVMTDCFALPRRGIPEWQACSALPNNVLDDIQGTIRR